MKLASRQFRLQYDLDYDRWATAVVASKNTDSKPKLELSQSEWECNVQRPVITSHVYVHGIVQT